MGASDFLSGRGPRLGSRVLADFTLARRTSEPATAGHRPQVLQRSRGATQLSLFDHLEPPGNTVLPVAIDPATGVDPRVAPSPDDPTRPAD